MKKVLILFVLAALPGIGAVAQNDFREAEFPKTEVFVGPAAIVSTSTNQFIGGSNAIFDDGIGIGSSLTYNFNSWFGITGEASVEAGSGNLFFPDFPVGFSHQQYFVGPRFTRRGDLLTWFGHVMPGMGRTHIDEFTEPLFGIVVPATNSSGFAMAYGGGVDVNLGRHFAFRVFQLDVITVEGAGPFDSRQANVRVQFGGVIRFGY